MAGHHFHFSIRLLIEEQFHGRVPYDVSNPRHLWIFLNKDSLMADQKHQALFVIRRFLKGLDRCLP